MREIIKKAVYDHLFSIGYSDTTAKLSSESAMEFFDRVVCNSKDPFKEICDCAGSLAQQRQVEVKYKSPKAKVKPRFKRPPSAFNF